MASSDKFIPPDYSEVKDDHPREDDDILEELEEDEGRIEKILDSQMSSSSSSGGSAPFPTGGWSPSSQAPQTKPWEQNNNSNSGVGSWNWSGGGGSSWKNPSWNQQSQPSTSQTGSNRQQSLDVRGLRRRAVILDVLDGLYESWEANGKPNILPRAIFDLKPKFEVWEKLQVFSPTKLYVIFPPNEMIPSFGNPEASGIAQEYVAHCISTYLRIPRRDCQIFQQMIQGVPKERILQSIIKDWTQGVGPNVGNQQELIYVGAHSGLYDMGTMDFDAAKNVGIDFMNLYNLSQGNYIIE